MVRLQGELDAVLQENKNLKEESEKSLRVMRKKLNTSQRYDHYATSVHKKAAEADGQVATLEAEKKKLAREKDHLQDSLAHCRAQLQEMQDKYENEENNISYNALLLKVNEYENNPSFRKYKSRRGTALGESIANGQAEQELAALKVAHAKALEKLMTLQEENDDMRQAVSACIGYVALVVALRVHDVLYSM
jgi:chromosome segregation ATPase